MENKGPLHRDVPILEIRMRLSFLMRLHVLKEMKDTMCISKLERMNMV